MMMDDIVLLQIYLPTAALINIKPGLKDTSRKNTHTIFLNEVMLQKAARKKEGVIETSPGVDHCLLASRRKIVCDSTLFLFSYLYVISVSLFCLYLFC